MQHKKKNDKYDCELSSQQNSEMVALVKSIGKNSKAIENLCAQGDKVLGSGGNLLCAAWKQDVVERLEFERDQTNSGVCIPNFLLLLIYQ